MTNSDFRISRTTAIWLVKVCTKIVTDAMNYPWNPISSSLARFRQNSYLYAVTADLDPQKASWVEAMFSVCRLLASALAFQMDPEELPTIMGSGTDLDFNDVTSVETIAGLGNDYFGLGHDANT